MGTWGTVAFGPMWAAWYGLLDKRLPVKTGPAIALKVVVTAVVMTPVSNGLFFSFMTAAGHVVKVCFSGKRPASTDLADLIQCVGPSFTEQGTWNEPHAVRKDIQSCLEVKLLPVCTYPESFLGVHANSGAH